MSNNTLLACSQLAFSQVRAAVPVRETVTIADALRAILAEVTPGTRPFSGDSYLPDHIIQAARLALADHDNIQDSAAQQHAHNALSMAAWHCARNEPAKALARIRRAKSHIMTSMDVTA